MSATITNPAPVLAPAQPGSPTSDTGRVISVLVRNQPSVLARISGLFSRRAYNIASLAVGPTENRQISRITIVVRGDLQVQQVISQLDKLVDVLAIAELDPPHTVSREVMLISVKVPVAQRPDLLDFIGQCKGTVVDVSEETLTFEVTGTPGVIEQVVAGCQGFEMVALARSGTIALPKTSAGEQAFLTCTGGITVGGADELPSLLVTP